MYVPPIIPQIYPRCYTVDAFANPYVGATGNPAAVVLLEQEADSLWMRRVALEFNLSETAFLWPIRKDQPTGSGNHTRHYCIRYHTPTAEVALCGHATLAAAAVLFQTAKNGSDDIPIVFHASSDVLEAVAIDLPHERTTIVSMKFPAKPVTSIVKSSSDYEAVASMIAVALDVAKQCILYIGLSKGLGDLLVEITKECYEGIGYDNLNIQALLEWDGYTRGVIICCHDEVKRGDDSDEVSFRSRFFGPKAGINEDPVTGSAHCALAPYFCSKFQKDRFVGGQDSKRGGFIKGVVVDDFSCVQLIGTAITTVSGTLWLS